MSEGALREASPNDENQGGSDENGRGNVTGACIKCRRDGRRQGGIEDAFDAETEPRDNPPRGIDHGGNAGARRRRPGMNPP